MASSGIGSESDPSASPSSLLLKSSSSSEKSATRSGNEQSRNGNHSHIDYEPEFIIHGKVTFTLEQVLKAQRGRRGIALLFL